MESLIAIPFLEEMILIRDMLIDASKRLSREEQDTCQIPGNMEGKLATVHREHSSWKMSSKQHQRNV